MCIYAFGEFAYIRIMRYYGIIQREKGGVSMGGKTSPASINKYIAKAYDRINLTIPKGAKERVKARADANGESVNGYVWRLVSADLDSEGEKG